VKIRYYQKPSGRSPVEDFLVDLPESTRLEVFDAITLLQNGVVLSMPLSRNLSGIRPGLHELRFRDRNGQVRVFYYLKRGEAIYIIHAFKKKTQHIPQKELDIVLKRIREI
jgi:phage-related protein